MYGSIYVYYILLNVYVESTNHYFRSFLTKPHFLISNQK